MPAQPLPTAPGPPSAPQATLEQLLEEGVTWADSGTWLPALPQASIDLFLRL